MGIFTGKTAIITGGGKAKSIGYGIATAYAKEGANLVLTGRNEQKLIDLQEELESCSCRSFRWSWTGHRTRMRTSWFTWFQIYVRRNYHAWRRTRSETLITVTITVINHNNNRFNRKTPYHILVIRCFSYFK